MLVDKTITSWLNCHILYKSQFQNLDFQKLVPRKLDVGHTVWTESPEKNDRGGIK